MRRPDGIRNADTAWLNAPVAFSNDRHVPGRGAHHTAQQLRTFAHAGLGFVFRLVAADRRLALEVPGERLEHRRGMSAAPAL